LGANVLDSNLIAASDRSLTAERSLAENVDEAVSRRRSSEPS
jgi:hypothetical protein